MDLVVRTPRMPQLGETVLGGNFCTAAGGKGANQAVAAARLGAEVAMVGRVGSDTLGDSLVDAIAAADVDYTYITRDPEAPTGVALITVDDVGRNTIVVALGANGELSTADVAAAEAALTATDVLLLQLETPVETVMRAAQIAHSHDGKVVLNPAPACLLPRDFLATVDVLVTNESESAYLTGSPVNDQDGARVAACTLVELGVDVVIITLGEQGALVAQREQKDSPPHTRLVAPFRVSPVDTTGAGDAFIASLAVALAEGKPLMEAVRWGNAAGALTTTKMGAQPSLPRRLEVETLLTETLTTPVQEA